MWGRWMLGVGCLLVCEGAVWGQALFIGPGQAEMKGAEDSLPPGAVRRIPVKVHTEYMRAPSGTPLKVHIGEVDGTVRIQEVEHRTNRAAWQAMDDAKGIWVQCAQTGDALSCLVYDQWILKYSVECVEGDCAAYAIDPATLPPAECGTPMNTEDAPEQEVGGEAPLPIPRRREVRDGPSLSSEGPSQTHQINDFECALRLLVVYTPTAKAARPTILNDIVNMTNRLQQSLNNVQVDGKVELVFVKELNYNSINIGVDLDYFIKDSDNVMDEVHRLREKHQADICVLITYGNYAGAALYMVATREYAFCVANITYALFNYTYEHEIGHIVGCNHAIGDKGTRRILGTASYYYPYAHGYKDSVHAFRTIMAYGCWHASCPRILYWSDPDQYFSSGVPMGTVYDPVLKNQAADNAYQWDHKFPNAMALLQPQNVVRLDSQDVVSEISGDVIARAEIYTNGTVTVDSGVDYRFTAGESIRLLPGFTAKTGAGFTARIAPVSECGAPDGEPSNLRGGKVILSSKGEGGPGRNNAQQKVIWLAGGNGTLPCPGILGSYQFMVYDLYGKLVHHTLEGRCENGRVSLSLPSLPQGVYYALVISREGERWVYKLVNL